MQPSGKIARAHALWIGLFLGMGYQASARAQIEPLTLVQPAPAADEQLSDTYLPTVAEDLDFGDFAPVDADRDADTPPALIERLPSPGPTILRQPWWSEAAASNELAGSWQLDQLIWLAIENSPYVQSILVEPQIQQARASATLGEFDPTTFLDSIFSDTSDPVGNELITGSAPRLNDHVWDNRSGVRKKNVRGGQFEMSQGFLFKDSNSDFFVPPNQADTQLIMSYSQPLARGSGTFYNRSSFVVASLAANRSVHQASQQIQQHAFNITTAYWELYAARAFQVQIQRGIQSLQTLRGQLRGRADIDSLRSQLLRADAAISRQRAALAQSQAHVRSAVARLRAAVAAPELQASVDLIPGTLPADWKTALSVEYELQAALATHPNVLSLRETLKASRVRLKVAEQELRPTLDLVLEGYLRGLNGDFDAAKSFGDQFSEGAPSYSAGVVFSRPYRNTAARAILRERRLELRRTLLELDQTLLTISADVESAVARVEAAYAQLEASVQSTLATHAELEYLTARWSNAFLDATQTSLMLDRLLSAEIQLIQAENAWARAQADHMLELAGLRLATGSILPIMPAAHSPGPDGDTP